MRIEGVTYDIPWGQMRRGMSIFVPCLDPEKAKGKVERHTDELGLRIIQKATIEDGIQGLRIWRT